MQDSSESVEAVYWRLGKIVVERVTVVKFRVDNRGSDQNVCVFYHDHYN